MKTARKLTFLGLLIVAIGMGLSNMIESKVPVYIILFIGFFVCVTAFIIAIKKVNPK